MRILLPLCLLALIISCSAPKAGNDTAILQVDPDAAEYNILRKGDTINIQLTGVPYQDLAVYMLKIDDAGNISMPHLGNIKAAGITTAELKSIIENLYIEKGIYKTPNITILAQPERYVSIYGEVRNPIRILYSRDMTILSLIANAGGFTEYADRANCQINRGGQKIPFNAKLALKDPTKDIPLLPGDFVHVGRTIF